MFMYLQLSPIMCACIFGNIRSICLYHKEAQTHFINVSQTRPDIANILYRIILFIKIWYAFQCGTWQCMNHSNVSFYFGGSKSSLSNLEHVIKARVFIISISQLA